MVSSASIPKGLRNKAQGCEQRATLGKIPVGSQLRRSCAINKHNTMPQSLSAVYIHVVFSTKERRPFLRDEAVRAALHSYLGGISKQLECPPIAVGGADDHIHLLARFGRKITQAEWVKELKRVSNLWLKKEHQIRLFEWQGGYADFSVSKSKIEQVRT